MHPFFTQIGIYILHTNVQICNWIYFKDVRQFYCLFSSYPRHGNAKRENEGRRRAFVKTRKLRT